MLRWTSPILLLAALVAGAAVAAADEFRGLRLEQALARLETRGLSILYSSDLVTAGLIVTVEPSTSDPRKILAEIVRPLGLAVVPGPGGAAMLVRASGSQATAGVATAATLRPRRPAPVSATEVEEIVVSASRYRLSFGPTAVATELSASDTDVPDLSGEVRFDPQAFAAGYSGQASPVLQVPRVQYVTDEDAADDGEAASTIRIKSGGLNVLR